MMKDNHVAGEGNAYYTLFREYDPDLGRWWRPDPIFQPWQSPYSAFDGNPIMLTDVWGLQGEVYKGAPPEGKAPTAPEEPNPPPEIPAPSIVPDPIPSTKIEEIGADIKKYGPNLQQKQQYKPASPPSGAVSDNTNQKGSTLRVLERVMPSLDKLNNALSKVSLPTLAELGIKGIRIRFGINEQMAEQILEAAKNNRIVRFYRGGATTLLKRAKVNPAIVREFEKNLAIAKGLKRLSIGVNIWDGFTSVYGMYVGYSEMNDENNNQQKKQEGALLMVQSAIDGEVTAIGILGGPFGAGFAIFWGLGGKDLFWWVVKKIPELPKGLIYRKPGEL